MHLLIKIIFGGIISYCILSILATEFKGVFILLLTGVAIALQYPAVNISAYIMAKSGVFDLYGKNIFIGYLLGVLIWGVVCLILYSAMVWLVLKLFL